MTFSTTTFSKILAKDAAPNSTSLVEQQFNSDGHADPIVS